MSKIYKCQFSLELPTPIVEDMKSFKIFSKDVIGFFVSYCSKAHITVIREQILTIEELDLFLKRFSKAINQLEAVEIGIDGFCVFDNKEPYTFFSKIKPFYLTKNWFDTLSEILPFFGERATYNDSTRIE